MINPFRILGTRPEYLEEKVKVPFKAPAFLWILGASLSLASAGFSCEKLHNSKMEDGGPLAICVSVGIIFIMLYCIYRAIIAIMMDSHSK